MSEEKTRIKIDYELVHLVRLLNSLKYSDSENPIITLASCSGHGKYHPTIVIKGNNDGWNWEIFSGALIKRKRKFYKKDSDGHFYIPEAEAYYER